MTADVPAPIVRQITNPSRLISQDAGRRLLVRCQPIGSFDPDIYLQGGRGYVYWTGGQVGEGAVEPIIHMLKSDCYWIRNAQGDVGGQHTDDLAMSLMILAHEAQHVVMQSPDETQVECSAYRKIGSLIRRLPVSAWRKRAIAESVGYVDESIRSSVGYGGECEV